MPAREIRPVPVFLGKTILLSSEQIRGITPSGEFSAEKRIAIQETMSHIIPLLSDGDRLRACNISTTLSYRHPTEKAERISRRHPRLRALAEYYFSQNESTQYFNDQAELYRGTTLGDILIAAIVNDGFVISTSHYEFENAPAVTQVTPNGVEAMEFAKGKMKDKLSVERTFYALQLDTFGFTKDDIPGSILLSPVILRFKNVGEERIDPYGLPPLDPIILSLMPVSGTNYLAANPPFHISETTDRWQEEFTRDFGIDIGALFTRAQESEQRHL